MYKWPKKFSKTPKEFEIDVMIAIGYQDGPRTLPERLRGDLVVHVKERH
ncbi:MAG: hypothetical protein ACTHKP_08630 [Nitrososphaeraceae archaeon]|jgi:hypothetical protein